MTSRNNNQNARAPFGGRGRGITNNNNNSNGHANQQNVPWGQAHSSPAQPKAFTNNHSNQASFVHRGANAANNNANKPTATHKPPQAANAPFRPAGFQFRHHQRAQSAGANVDASSVSANNASANNASTNNASTNNASANNASANNASVVNANNAGNNQQANTAVQSEQPASDDADNSTDNTASNTNNNTTGNNTTSNNTAVNSSTSTDINTNNTASATPAKAAVVVSSRRHQIEQKREAFRLQAQNAKNNAAQAAGANPLKAINSDPQNSVGCQSPTCVARRRAELAQQQQNANANAVVNTTNAVANTTANATTNATSNVTTNVTGNATTNAANSTQDTNTTSGSTSSNWWSFKNPFGKKNKTKDAVVTSSATSTSAPTSATSTSAPTTPTSSTIVVHALDTLQPSVDQQANLPKDAPTQAQIAQDSFNLIDQYQKNLTQKIVTLPQITSIVNGTLSDEKVTIVSAIQYYQLLYSLCKQTVAQSSGWGGKAILITHVISKIFKASVETAFGGLANVPRELQQICQLSLRRDLMWFIKKNKAGIFVSLRKDGTCANIIADEKKFAEQRAKILQLANASTNGAATNGANTTTPAPTTAASTTVTAPATPSKSVSNARAQTLLVRQQQRQQQQQVKQQPSTRAGAQTQVPQTQTRSASTTRRRSTTTNSADVAQIAGSKFQY